MNSFRIHLIIKFSIYIGLNLTLLTSCLNNQTNNSPRDNQSSDSESPRIPPDNDTKRNYLQNGQTQTNTTLTIFKNHQDFIYLRGSEVDSFLNENRRNEPLCLVIEFPTSQDKNLLIGLLRPQSFLNFEKNEQENYFLIDISNEVEVKSFCQTPGLLQSLEGQYSNYSPAYQITDLCGHPGCNSGFYTSRPLKIFAPSGEEVSAIRVNHLNLRINNSTTPEGEFKACESNSNCLAQGFDCCLSGVCAKDMQIRPNAKDHEDYLQAVEDILNDPLSIYDYPHLYFICNIPGSGGPPQDNTPPGNPQQEAQERFQEKKELFQCTHPIEGEKGICTIRYEEVSIDGLNTYSTRIDDRNFSSTYTGTTGLSSNTITKIVYAGLTLFENGSIKNSGLTLGPGNDNLDEAQIINLNIEKPSNAPNDTLTIHFQIDASCERINPQLARCRKHYTQGQNEGKITDHFPASNTFILPYYADTNRSIQVFVAGNLRVPTQDWNLELSFPPRVVFTGVDPQVFDSQEVEILFFVNTDLYPVTLSQDIARSRINEMCGCSGNVTCNLQEVRNSSNAIIDYKCKYPDPVAPIPPMQQTISLNSKATPHRFFDEQGVYHSEITGSTPVQEGKVFSYASGNLLRPNNKDAYIGFNEIYGSYTPHSNSALPAREVRVIPGKTYDLFVYQGQFSTCHFCGNDYYSNLAKLFPQTFLNYGGGLTPSPDKSSKLNPGHIRADDFIFGRACFIPATMIPWTHRPRSTTQDQRLRRLEAQHFLFANGYQRDWYGFDYGSVIGSFDGVKWFSVGNERRIKAESNKLFLAINAYFGDLTSNGTYTVHIHELAGSAFSGNTNSNDHTSLGAQCRHYHMCNTDQDCVTQLGWDYSCETVNGVKSAWPVFDTNAVEIPGEFVYETLFSLFNVNQGGAKRCVYRGRGAPCHANYSSIAENQSYTGTEGQFHPGLKKCASNYHCQRFLDGSSGAYFNNRISRYGRTVKQRNADREEGQNFLEEFGLGSPIIGRPYNYHGNENILSEGQMGLSFNNIQSVCLPGKDPGYTTIGAAHSERPTSLYLGDKLNAQGMTLSSTEFPSIKYKSACPLFDHSGNFIHKQLSPNISLSSQGLSDLAARQVISSNALKIFESEIFADQKILYHFEIDEIDQPVLQANRCLRAPGSVCHTEIDCAPNKLMTQNLQGFSYDEILDYFTLNRYEVEFWREELICGQRYLPSEAGFDLRNNRCCRETGKKITVGTWIDQLDFASNDLDYPDFYPEFFPGIDHSHSNRQRHSRNATIADIIINQSSPPLISSRLGQCASGGGCLGFNAEIRSQWKTLSAMNKRTCCSQDWIRHFHPDNGGGYRWNQEKHQRIDKEGFRCFNWLQCSNISSCPVNFSCVHTSAADEPDCLIKQTSQAEAQEIFNFTAKLELLGIPQIALPANNFNNGAHLCRVNPNNQMSAGTIPLPNKDGEPLLNFLNPGEYVENANKFGAHILENFHEDLKPIFSKDEFSCCLAVGTIVDQTTSADKCCSGFLRYNSDNTARCSLPDYTNLSVFYNRYVSSAASELSDSLFDEDTGFAKNPSTIEQLACIQRACASNTIARGVSLSRLKVPGHDADGDDYLINRFIDSSEQASNFSGLADLYDEGLRWNNHIYCVPEALSNNAGDDLIVIRCGE